MLHVLDVKDTIDSERFVQAQFDPTNYDRKASAANDGSISSGGTIGTIPPPLLSPEVWGDIDASAFKVRGRSYNLGKNLSYIYINTCMNIMFIYYIYANIIFNIYVFIFCYYN